MLQDPRRQENAAGLQHDGQSVSRADATPIWKRGLDLAVLLLLSPVVVPTFLVIAALVRLTSEGPAIFRQERVGLGGTRFTLLKFRSMTTHCDTQVHAAHVASLITSDKPMQKLDQQGDPRITPFGAFLRATCLDELPQLVNVLRGEMSVVGPRPCLPNEYEQYLPWQKERLNTLPGLTGLWQVSGKNDRTFTEMMHLDVKYTRERTFALDVSIIARTIPVLFRNFVSHFLRKTGRMARQAAIDKVERRL